MTVDEKRKWDDYYRSAVEVDLPEVRALGQELAAWIEGLLPEGSRRVLEAGCGSGSQSLALARRGGFDVHLLDASDEAIAVARDLFARSSLPATFHSGDIFDPGRADFNLVFNAGVIEHYSFEDQVRMVRAMARRSTGYVLVLAPNVQCYWYWISRLNNSVDGNWPFGAEAPVSHLRDVFEAAGVELAAERYLGREWASLFLKSVPGIDAALRERLLELHASPLIPDEHSCYLYGAVGLPSGSEFGLPPPSDRFIGDSLRALAADALAVRVAAEKEIAQLRTALRESEERVSAAVADVGRLEHRSASERASAADALASAHQQAAAVEQRAVEAEQRAAAAEQRAAALEGELQRERRTAASIHSGIGQFEAAHAAALDSYRRQRAWRLMIAIRKAYDLATRRGVAGMLRALGVLARAPFGTAAYEEQEIRLPSVRNFLPALAAPALPEVPDLAAPLPRAYDIVILAIIDFDFRFQRPQQLAVQWARAGHRVFWVSPTRFLPGNASTPYLMRELQENIWEVHMRGLAPDIYLGELDDSRIQCFDESLRALYRDLAISENVVVIQLPFWRQLALALQRNEGGVLAYDCMDEWDSFENMGDFNRREEADLVRECDVLTVTARRLAGKFEERGLRPVLVRNGVDYPFFASAAQVNLLNGIGRPIVGYFGAIADWIDLDLVAKVARNRPQYSFVLIGQVFNQDVAALQSLPNVHLLGNQPYAKIPAFLREFDACLIPFRLNAVTAATDPVKLYEYLSLGKPVVATDMDEIRPYRELLHIAAADRFEEAIDAAVHESDPELPRRRVAFAQENTWQQRSQVFHEAVRARFPLVSIAIVTYNSSRVIRGCLESIFRNDTWPNREIIVVDNASTDDTASMIEGYAGKVHFERLPANRGFAGANNRAARIASGDYLILLNADTVVTPGWIGRLVGHLRRNSTLALVCPTTNFAGNEAKVDFTYSDRRSMERFAASVTVRARGVTTDLSMAPLFCAAIERSLYMELGGLDESYGRGMFEDDDLSAAVRQRGLRVAVAEDCFVHHFGQASFAALPAADYSQLFEENRDRFEKKWGVRWQPHRLRAGVKGPLDDVRYQPESFNAGED